MNNSNNKNKTGDKVELLPIESETKSASKTLSFRLRIFQIRYFPISLRFRLIFRIFFLLSSYFDQQILKLNRR